MPMFLRQAVSLPFTTFQLHKSQFTLLNTIAVIVGEQMDALPLVLTLRTVALQAMFSFHSHMQHALTFNWGEPNTAESINNNNNKCMSMCCSL